MPRIAPLLAEKYAPLQANRNGLQGISKANVRLVEDHCRVTGVSNARHLRASHIKPWAVPSNEEKLDGFNGQKEYLDYHRQVVSQK